MLCPTGAFMHLPVHAAGDYFELDGECVSDYAVPSYTPTITALLNARRDFVPVLKGEAKVLLTAIPKPFQGPPLPHTKYEALMVRHHVPTNVLVSSSESATVADVVDKLPSASIVHLACHGKQDAVDALQSGFALSDGLLTVSKLMELRLPRAFLAVLSACETAKADATQPDQAVHLAATMLFAGFRSVVATMWYVRDLTV
jgi:CHAT domain-containing protein